MYNWDDPIEEALNKPEVAKTAPVIQETKEIEKSSTNAVTPNNISEQGYTGMEDLEHK